MCDGHGLGKILRSVYRDFNPDFQSVLNDDCNINQRTIYYYRQHLKHHKDVITIEVLSPCIYLPPNCIVSMHYCVSVLKGKDAGEAICLGFVNFLSMFQGDTGTATVYGNLSRCGFCNQGVLLALLRFDFEGQAC